MRFKTLLLSLLLFAIALPAQAGLIDNLKTRFDSRAGARQHENTTESDKAVEEPHASTTRLAGITVAYWLPPSEMLPAPLIIFSHGFHGCKTQSTFLMEALAAHGYVVVAPDHEDNSCGFGNMKPPVEAFRKVDGWTENTYVNRADDIKSVYKSLHDDRIWTKRIDWNNVGLAGHSLGGYTVLGLGGAWKSWKMPGIKSILALSPYCAPFVDDETLKNIDVPVMYQGGTRDLGITPWLKKEHGAFDQTPHGYYVELDKTGHFGWTGLISETHDEIIKYSLAFFDKTLKGDNTPMVKDSGAVTLRSK